MISSLLLSTVVCLNVGADPGPAELAMGDVAPKLEIKEFVKGEPVKEFAKGKTYVVEFWATWCMPCRESIPHLTKLQQKFKDVVFLGISEDDQADLVKPFVDKMGSKMNYRVAMDARDGKQSRMGQTWLEASGQEGIPTAFVINGDGKVAWIGHPNELERTLKQIANGKWDLAAEAAEYKQMMAEEKASRQAEERLDKLLKDKDYAAALKATDEIAQKGGELAAQVGAFRLALMSQLHSDAEKIIAEAKAQAKEADQTNSKDFLSILRAIISPVDLLNPDSQAKTDTLAKLDPAVAKYVAELADKTDALLKAESADKTAEKPAADKPADGEETDNIGESGFLIADSNVLLARAYQATGDKDKAAAKYDDAVKALNSVIRAARDDMKDIREMKKALSGEAGAAKAVDEKSSEDAAKPVVRRKKVVEP